MSTRPVVLIAPRWEPQQPSVTVPEQLAPEETMANVFADALIDAGATPLMMALTDDEAVLDAYLALADGVAIPGGQDVDPALWGERDPYTGGPLCPQRDAFELALVRRVLDARMPLLTTCRGTQLLNVTLGGTLCMDVPGLEPRPGMALWRHQMVLNDPAHPVEVEEESLLARALGSTRVQANSSHHCCVDRLGSGVRLVARATDGVPEAIEVEGQPFCVGVQWHPEYTWRSVETDRRLWHAFVDACR